MKPYRVGNAVEAKPWDRKLWGVVFIAADAKPVLISRMWAASTQPRYLGEPISVLVFASRKFARDWCKARNVAGSNRIYRPVRVRETVTVIS